MRCLRSANAPLKACVTVATVVASATLAAQMPSFKGIGRTPSEQAIRTWDIAVGPSGKELPPGRGTAKEGAAIYAAKCASCHGPNGEGTRAGRRLLGGDIKDPERPVRSIETYWPFATTIWDYTNRAMPRGKEGSLAPDEVYALTAWMLHKGGVIAEDAVMDQTTLPKVEMPFRKNFWPAPWPTYRDYDKNCPIGRCR